MKKKDFWNNKTVLITGANGFVGTAVFNILKKEKKQIKKILTPTHKELDLTIESEVNEYFKKENPDIIIHLAGKVGGILANKLYPAEFYYQNLMMGTLILEYAKKYNIEKITVLAAGCGYPINADIPYKEEDSFNGLPQEESISYSMAKKMLVIQAKAYKEQYGLNTSILLPANLYGMNDNFDLNNSHVVPALIRKFIEAKQKSKKEVVIWGNGKSTREFLYVEDAANAIIDITEKYNEIGPLNLGTGIETSIKELVNKIKNIVKYSGNIVWDNTKPNGQNRRVYNMDKFKDALGYVPKTNIEDGLVKTIKWYYKKKETK